MGALAKDYDYWANSAGQGNGGKTAVPANNPVYKPSVDKSLTQQKIDLAFKNAQKGTNKLGAIVNMGVLLSELFSALNSKPADEVVQLTDDQQQILKNADLTMQQADKLNDYLTRQQNAMTPPASGETLPAVLTNNAKALVTSVNSLTSTLGEKFDYFNNYFYGLLTYMDIATGLMDKTYTLNKELADNAKKKEDDNTLQVGDSKMSPAEIEARKNLAMLKAYDFKNTPVDQSVLEADNVLGMTPLQIEASHRSFEVESKVYAKTPQKVKDWDENELADIAPREARLVKDATTAIKHTDENNFELDPEDVDLITPLDIKSVFGYNGDSGGLQELFKRLGGVGLPTT